MSVSASERKEKPRSGTCPKVLITIITALVPKARFARGRRLQQHSYLEVLFDSDSEKS